MESRYIVRVVKPPGQMVQLVSGSPVVIGKNSRCTLKIRSQALSDFQVKISVGHNGHVYIQDTDPYNHMVMINGRLCAESPTRLDVGTEFRLGSFIFQLEADPVDGSIGSASAADESSLPVPFPREAVAVENSSPAYPGSPMMGPSAVPDAVRVAAAATPLTPVQPVRKPSSERRERVSPSRATPPVSASAKHPPSTKRSPSTALQDAFFADSRTSTKHAKGNAAGRMRAAQSTIPTSPTKLLNSPVKKPPTDNQPKVKQSEVKQSEVKQSEVKQSEVKRPKVKRPKVKRPKVKQSEVKPSEVKPSEVKPSEVKPSEVKPSEVKPSEVKPSERSLRSSRTRLGGASKDRHGYNDRPKDASLYRQIRTMIL